MARGSRLIWVPLLLCCAFQATDNQNVQPLQNLGNILSQIGLPEGIDPKNISVTSVTVKTCTGLQEQMTLLNKKLKETNIRNKNLDEEAFGLRSKVRLLEEQLAKCNATIPTGSGCYQTELQNRLHSLLNTADNDAFLILKVIQLTTEVNKLQTKIHLVSGNSSETSAATTSLQKDLQEKLDELKDKKRLIEESNANSALIFDIILKQIEIWNLEQEESSKGGTSNQTNNTVEGIQEQLNKKIQELQRKRDAASPLLELIFVHSRIATIERLIRVYNVKVKTGTSDYLKQVRQKSELLTQKIVQLGYNESDQFLTQEILKLQGELDLLKQTKDNFKKTTESQIKEKRELLKLQITQKELLQNQLQDSDAQAHKIIKIISLMKELRETQIDETTPTNSITLQGLLQTKEREYAKALTEINELQRKLRLKTQQCSGLEEIYSKTRTDFEQKIAELNQTGEFKTALVLNVINLQNEISSLKDQIFVTDDSKRIKELEKLLQEKQRQLQDMNADITRLVANPTTILRIIRVQNEIWDLQRSYNETTTKTIEELQTTVDRLISELGSGDGNTKLMLNILTQQNQVENLRRQLLDQNALHTSELTKLKNDLTAKRRTLQEFINELNEKNKTNGKLILDITNLQFQLKNLDEQRRYENTTSSLTINQLKAELRTRKQEHARNQVEIRFLKALHENGTRQLLSTQNELKELQKKLQINAEECSEQGKRYNELSSKTELEKKIKELIGRDETKAGSILNIIYLHGELMRLTELIDTAKQKNPTKVSELQTELKNKQSELSFLTELLQTLIAYPNTVLKIIQLQNEIWTLQIKNTNGTSRDQIQKLQNRVDGLISEIDSKDDNDIKLILQIISLQSQVEQLQQLSNLKVLKNTEAAQLVNNLSATKNLLQKFINEFKNSNQINADLILNITELTKQLQNLEVEKQDGSQTSADIIAKLREELKIKSDERLEDVAKINALQDKLNQTEAQCSVSEQQLKALQVDLDKKIRELLSKSNTVGSLALQISTLNLQLEELRGQLQNTESKTKLTELQKIVDEKKKELDKKTEELKERSPQAQRLLSIILLQTEIEKYVNVAANDSDFDKIKALEARVNQLIEGIQDEEEENTKLTFQVVAQQDEIARLRKLLNAQNKAYSDKIAGLQNELDHTKNQIREKTELLKISGTRIPNLTTQIMNLHQKVKPLEEEIAELKATNAEKLKELQKRLDLRQKQLQDSELRLSNADAENFNLIMEITDLRSQLKNVPKATNKLIKELEEKIQTQQSQNKKLENENRDLQQEVGNLKASCSDNTDCEDVHIQLQQSQEEVKRLQELLQDKDAELKQLQEELDEQGKMTNVLQQEITNLEKETSELEMLLKKQQQETDERTTDYYKLQEDYHKLQNENNELQETVHGLQNRLSDKEDKTIFPRRITLDPDTAHPRIVLSAGNTMMSTVGQIQDIPDNPGRYDVDLAALGSVGFSSGRQYWEVSVAGKLCYHIGMACECAQRKGTISYKPHNGYWTLVLNKQGQLRAFDKRSTVIQNKTPPLKLGILLDYGSGQISFYDAGARSHIYSFTGQTFTDKIYPFINYCVEEGVAPSPIALVSPGSVDWIQ